jgi:hypothetical protein
MFISNVTFGESPKQTPRPRRPMTQRHREYLLRHDHIEWELMLLVLNED